MVRYDKPIRFTDKRKEELKGVSEKPSVQLDLAEYERALDNLKTEVVNLGSTKEYDWSKMVNAAQGINREVGKLELFYGLRQDTDFKKFQKNIKSFGGSIRTNDNIDAYSIIGIGLPGIFGTIAVDMLYGISIGDVLATNLIPLYALVCPLSIPGLAITFTLAYATHKFMKKSREEKLNQLVDISEQLLKYLKKVSP